MRTGSVGRHEDLDEVVGTLTRGFGVLLTGPIGVGRSHLCDRITDHGRSVGVDVLALRGVAAGRRVPAGVVTDDPTHDPAPGPASLRRRVQRRVNGDGPSWVVVDDVHLLDDGSLAELLGLAHRGDVVVVASCPDTAVTDLRVQDLWRSDLLARSRVAPLPRRHADALLEHWLHGPASRALRAAAWTATLGVPLTLHDWLDGARACGALVDRGDYWDVAGPVRPGERLRDLAARHLEGLPDATRAAMLAIALGEPIGLDVVHRVAAPPELADLERRGLVAVDDGPPATVVTTVPALADVVRDEAGPLQRRMVLEGVVDAAGDGRDGGVDPVRLAAWTLELGRTPGPEVVARAAPLALGRFDLATAESLADLMPPSTVASVVLGRAAALQGRFEEGLDHLRRAREQARDDRERVEATAALLEATAFIGGDRAAAQDLLEDTLRTTDDPDLRRELKIRSGLLPALDGRFDAALALAPALDEGGLPPAVEAQGRVVLALARAMTGRVDGVLEDLDPADALAVGVAGEQPALPTQAGIARVLALQALLRHEEARALTERMLDVASGPDLGPWLTIDVPGLVLRGELDTATTRLRQSGDILVHADVVGLQAVNLAAMAMVHAIRGQDPATLVARVRGMPGGDEPRAAVWADAADVWWAIRRGDADGAARLALRDGRSTVDHDHVVWGALVLHLATRAGRPDVVLADLDPMHGDRGPLVDVVVEHTRAAAAGDPDELARVAGRWEQAGLTGLAVDAWAACARAHGDAGARTRGLRAAVHAHELADACPTYDAPLLAGVAPPLSPRQRSAARLAAAGHTSREIGRALDISPKTVDNHLHVVYRTLDLDGREELRTVLGRRRTTPSQA